MVMWVVPHGIVHGGNGAGTLLKLAHCAATLVRAYAERADFDDDHNKTREDLVAENIVNLVFEAKGAQETAVLSAEKPDNHPDVLLAFSSSIEDGIDISVSPMLTEQELRRAANYLLMLTYVQLRRVRFVDSWEEYGGWIVALASETFTSDDAPEDPFA
jgi:hypothetical protein